MCSAGLYSPHEPCDLRPLQTIVTTSPALNELAAQLQAGDLIGLDTEFLRERTYRPGLAYALRLSAWRRIKRGDVAGVAKDVRNLAFKRYGRHSVYATEMNPE